MMLYMQMDAMLYQTSAITLILALPQLRLY